ncbi:MAG: hypothetical protein K9K32_00495 [Halanaerobiales bacterium]|nr:hypothetical protein [Halanaerobiales bacterium]MCF8008216.1 hypothetical protein [Halanaerobiales bacterium]
MADFSDVKPNIYNISFYGTSGRIGEGANAEILFIQSTLKMKEIENLKLIVDIPGSEKWSIKDLFQRNVDRNRLTGPNGLKQYFTNKNQVKYFNPIAIVLLPTEDNKIVKDLQKLTEENEIEYNGIEGTKYINSDIYQLYIPDKNQINIGKIEWNSDRCYAVAVDGQHRLTALKELNNSQEHDDLKDWQIPVVFLVPNKIERAVESDGFLEIIRKIFMYINMKAEEVNDSRAILLNDESIECICTQETISKFHKNDIDDETKKYIPPLYLVDWRGERGDTKSITNERYIYENKEMRNWLGEYVIGRDFTYTSQGEKQLKTLDLYDLDLDLINSNTISQSDAKKIRGNYNDLIRDAFIKFITHLKPYNNYIKKCRNYEIANSNNDSEKKAFMEMRYGYITKMKSESDEINEFKDGFDEEFIRIKKDTLSEFCRQDICMRGFVYAYGELYEEYKRNIVRSELDWYSFTTTFLPAFNNLFDEGWCFGYDELENDKKKLLTHICHNEAGGRINYKLDQVKRAWGIFVLMSAVDYAQKNEVIDSADDLKYSIWEEKSDILRSTLEKGFRKVAKRKYDQKEMTKAEKRRKINEDKEKMARERITELEDLWDMNINE